MTTASQRDGQFALADEQLELRDLIRRLVDRHVRPRAAEIDATG